MRAGQLELVNGYSVVVVCCANVLATSKVIPGLAFDSAHSWQLYSAAPTAKSGH